MLSQPATTDNLHPFTISFSPAGGLALPALGLAARAQGIQAVWLRLLASRMYLHAGSLAYQAVTDAAPVGDRLVVAEDQAGAALAVLRWDHQIPKGWKVQQWGSPPSASPHLWQWSTEDQPRPLFAKFSADELGQILSVVSEVLDPSWEVAA